jgi:hypothetical protein
VGGWCKLEVRRIGKSSAVSEPRLSVAVGNAVIQSGFPALSVWLPTVRGPIDVFEGSYDFCIQSIDRQISGKR